jgi:hypothetical protein
MARPRKYEDDNARAAAYRARIEAAAAAGDRDAELVRARRGKLVTDGKAELVRDGGLDSTLRNLALWFRRRAETAGADDR